MNTKEKTAAGRQPGRRSTSPNRSEDDRLSIASSFTYGFQHVLTMYGGIIASR